MAFTTVLAVHKAHKRPSEHTFISAEVSAATQVPSQGYKSHFCDRFLHIFSMEHLTENPLTTVEFSCQTWERSVLQCYHLLSQTAPPSAHSLPFLQAKLKRSLKIPSCKTPSNPVTMSSHEWIHEWISPANHNHPPLGNKEAQEGITSDTHRMAEVGSDHWMPSAPEAESPTAVCSTQHPGGFWASPRAAQPPCSTSAWAHHRSATCIWQHSSSG